MLTLTHVLFDFFASLIIISILITPTRHSPPSPLAPSDQLPICSTVTVALLGFCLCLSFSHRLCHCHCDCLWKPAMYQVPPLAPPSRLVDIQVWRKSLKLCKQNVITCLKHTEFYHGKHIQTYYLPQTH